MFFFFQLSYQIVDSLIWLGIRDMINDVRKKKLKLRPVTYLSGSQGSDTDIPHGYIWSPHLVPKPKGGCFWFNHVLSYCQSYLYGINLLQFRFEALNWFIPDSLIVVAPCGFQSCCSSEQPEKKKGGFLCFKEK